MMEKNLSNINLSFDFWTSGNFKSYMAIVAHFINETHINHTLIIGLRQVLGQHSKANQADILLQVICDYNITDKLGYFVLDNIESNNVCVDLLLKQLCPNFHKKYRRLRYVGHIINLAAHAFLYGKDPKAFIIDAVHVQDTH